jgi:hypothetical protein
MKKKVLSMMCCACFCAQLMYAQSAQKVTYADKNQIEDFFFL